MEKNWEKASLLEKVLTVINVIFIVAVGYLTLVIWGKGFVSGIEEVSKKILCYAIMFIPFILMVIKVACNASHEE